MSGSEVVAICRLHGPMKKANICYLCEDRRAFEYDELKARISALEKALEDLVEAADNQVRHWDTVYSPSPPEISGGYILHNRLKSAVQKARTSTGTTGEKEK